MARSTVLILGAEEDEHTRHMLAHLRSHGQDVQLVDSRWFPSRMTISFDPQQSDGYLRLPGDRMVGFEQVLSVYWRGYHGVEIPPLPDGDQRWIAHNDARGLMESVLMQLS